MRIIDINNEDIKFRVWTGNKMEYDVVAGKFGIFYTGGIDPNDNASLQTTTKYEPFNGKINCMQYVGIKDLEKKDIYENDIVRADRDFDEKGRVNVVYVVKFYKGECLLTPCRYLNDPFNDSTLFSRLCPISYYHNIKVLGNIYENYDIIEKYNDKDKGDER